MWQDILKGRRMSPHAQKLVDKVMTATPKPINAILEDMFNEMKNAKDRSVRTGKQVIPTRTELRNYLNKNYSRVKLSERTGRPVTGNRDSLIHYYK